MQVIGELIALYFNATGELPAVSDLASKVLGSGRIRETRRWAASKARQIRNKKKGF
jgi:hypothetical protein